MFRHRGASKVVDLPCRRCGGHFKGLQMNRAQILNNDTRPRTKPIDADNIPAPMKQERRWLAWNWQRRNGKWSKVPVGKSNDETTWSDFETIWTLYATGGCEGIGFVLGDGWAGVDLDGCRVDGELSPLAHDVIGALNSYCEVSPTGTGVKLFCRASLPEGKTKNADGTVEIYCKGRFFCVTGDKVSGDIQQRQSELESLHARYIDVSQPGNPALAAMLRIKPKDTEQDGTRRLFSWACRAVEFNLTDEIAIATIREAEKTHPFPVFFGDGDILARIRDAEEKTTRGCARTEIQLGADFPRVVRETIGALAKIELYQHLGRLTRVVHDPPKCKYAKNDYGAPRLGFIPPGMMLETLTSAADFYRFDAKSHQYVRCLPTTDLRAAISQRGDYPNIPPIHGVVSRPILLPDGRIITTPGYNVETGLFLNIDGEWPATMSTDESVAMYFDVWSDFPFATESSRSGALSAQLTLLTRQVIGGNVPIHVVDGNRSGVGKGLLTDCWTIVSEGRRASRYTLGKPDELKKYLTSLAVRGADYVLFDNVTGRLGGPVIEAAMTSGSISDRLLGASEIIDVPLSITWLATVNDYTCTRDMVRRTLPIQLDTSLINPEERGGFKYPYLLEHLMRNRRQLLIAGLSIVSNYINAGMPGQAIENLGGFEDWSDLVRSAIVWAGLADPLADRKQLQDSAEEAANPRTKQLIEAWTFEGPVTVKQALTLAADDGAYVTLRSFLDGKPEGLSEAEFLGKQLRSARGQSIGGRKIDRTEHATAKWYAIAV